MREDCKNFQSRTYASGEVARFCVLDLAPEAPWRCPENCSRYERRMADIGWELGGLVRPRVPDEPEIIELNDDAAAVLDEAEDILNAAGPTIVSEVQRQRAREQGERAGAGILDRLKDRFRKR
ncbi:MAG: hypothetical protein KY454_07650 [Actinobacteria bacterium]|nr:hypothetical protein [Actinomycetota bacterium]MBW3650906.1 hypothetical protein [Actinomycetota bacterium]